MTLLELSEKLERLANRLPGPLQKPLLREITPIKEIFLKQRPPRMLLLGTQGIEKERLINALFGSVVAVPDPLESSTGTWQEFSRPGRGHLRFLDARNLASANRIKSALATELPDLVILIKGQAESLSTEAEEHAERVFRFIAERKEIHAPLLGIVVLQKTSDEEEGSSACRTLHDRLRANPALSRGLVKTLPVRLESEPGPEEINRQTRIDALAEALTSCLPDNAKLEMARLSGARSAQAHIAQILTRSASAMAGAIGAQPIPLADFPILTSLQVTMVAAIMYVSGQEVTPRLAAQFIAALGTNISAGLVLREGARALLKLFPGWGNAISGGIASAGTYGIGKAAMAYFIEGASLPDARKLFRRSSKSAIEKKRLGQ